MLHRDHADGALRQQPLEHALRAAERLLRGDAVGHVDRHRIDRDGGGGITFGCDVDLEPAPEELDDLHHRLAGQRALEEGVDLRRVAEVVGDRTPHRVARRDRVVELDRPGPQVADPPIGRDPQRSDLRVLEHVQQPLLAREELLLQVVEVGEVVDEGADDRVVTALDEELVDQERAVPQWRAHRDDLTLRTRACDEPLLHGDQPGGHRGFRELELRRTCHRQTRFPHQPPHARARVEVAAVGAGEDDPGRRELDDAAQHRRRQAGEVTEVGRRLPRYTLVAVGRHGANGTPGSPRSWPRAAGPARR